MLGAMAAQPKVRKVAQRQQRTKLGALEKPKEVKNINTEDKQVDTSRLSWHTCRHTLQACSAAVPLPVF